MKILAIVQARMDSTRLGGKILRILGDREVLWHVVDRSRRIRQVDQVVVATTVKPTDDVTASFCRDNGIDCFRGSDEDVLDRFYGAAREYGADHIVRITADCPVLDPVIVEGIIDAYFREGYDVCRPGTEFPDGLDCAIFSFAVLEDTWKNATLPSDREHISPYMERHTDRYRVGMVDTLTGLGHHRWTLDEPEDYQFLQELFKRLYRPGEVFLTADILAVLEREPELIKINSAFARNEGYLKSLEKDEALTGRRGGREP